MRYNHFNIIVIFSLLVMSMMFYTQAQAGDKKLTVDVVPDFNTFSFVDLDGNEEPSPGEPFMVEGVIHKKRRDFGTGDPIGIFLCRGFFIVPQDDGDATYVSQSFEIDGKGTIFVQGNEPGKTPGVNGLRRAIVGVTGSFKKGFGQAIIEDMGGPFRITFIFKEKVKVSSHALLVSDSEEDFEVVEQEVDQDMATLELQQNYPNPFNPETQISFKLAKSSDVAVKIFNALGQEVRTLSQQQYTAGSHTLRWDGNDNFGNAVASGVYVYRLEVEDLSVVKKMNLIR